MFMCFMNLNNVSPREMLTQRCANARSRNRYFCTPVMFNSAMRGLKDGTEAGGQRCYGPAGSGGRPVQAPLFSPADERKGSVSFH